MIILGLILFTLGFLIITGTYALFVYAILPYWDSPIHDITLQMILSPGILLIIFLILSVIFTKKLLQHKKWKKMYTLAMIFYIFSLGYYYVDLGEPVQKVISFGNFLFVLATIFIFVGFRRKAKKLQQTIVS